eukprot:s3484_g6.t1
MPCRSGKHCGLTEKSCLPGGSGVYFAAALLPSRLALDVSGFGRRVLHTVVRVLRSLGRLESGVRFWGGARALQVNVRTGKSTFDFPDGWVKMKSRSNGATYYWNPKTGASQLEVPPDAADVAHAARRRPATGLSACGDAGPGAGGGGGGGGGAHDPGQSTAGENGAHGNGP